MSRAFRAASLSSCAALCAIAMLRHHACEPSNARDVEDSSRAFHEDYESAYTVHVGRDEVTADSTPVVTALVPRLAPRDWVLVLVDWISHRWVPVRDVHKLFKGQIHWFLGLSERTLTAEFERDRARLEDVWRRASGQTRGKERDHFLRLARVIVAPEATVRTVHHVRRSLHEAGFRYVSISTASAPVLEHSFTCQWSFCQMGPPHDIMGAHPYSSGRSWRPQPHTRACNLVSLEVGAQGASVHVILFREGTDGRDLVLIPSYSMNNWPGRERPLHRPPRRVRGAPSNPFEGARASVFHALATPRDHTALGVFQWSGAWIANEQGTCPTVPNEVEPHLVDDVLVRVARRERLCSSMTLEAHSDVLWARVHELIGMLGDDTSRFRMSWEISSIPGNSVDCDDPVTLPMLPR